MVYYILGILNMYIGYRCVYPDKYGVGGSWVSADLDLPVDLARRVFTPVISVVENSVGASMFASRLVRRSYRRFGLLFWESMHLPNSSRTWSHAWGHVLSRISQSKLVGNETDGYELLLGANRDPVEALPLEIVYMIAGYSHYDDLKSLSQSSWALRTTFFGEADPQNQLDALRPFACDGLKSGCTVCGSQICPVNFLPPSQPQASRILCSPLTFSPSPAPSRTRRSVSRSPFVTSTVASPIAHHATGTSAADRSDEVIASRIITTSASFAT